MVTEQVSQIMPHLKPGSSYLFDHVRKGPFVAEYLGTRPTKEGDPDDVFIHVNIVTEDGSGQERLAHTFIYDEFGRKIRPPFEGRLIRPSLLTSITSPSSSDQKQLTEKFNAAREKAEATTNPVYPSLSLPTEKAMSHLDGSVSEPKKPGIFKRMFRRS